MDNRDIADRFDRLANLLDLEGANTFRVRAYRRAAAKVRSHGRSMADMVAEGADLSTLDGIGDDLAGKIAGLVQDGSLPDLDAAEQRVPPGLLDLLDIEDLGPRKVRALHDALGINGLDDLDQAVRQGRVREVAGFGARTEEKIREALARHRAGSGGRILLSEARAQLDPLVRRLEDQGAERLTVAGSVRRRRETAGDGDILAIADDAPGLMQALVDDPAVAEVIAHGRTKSSVRLESGFQVDLRVVAAESFGAALHYFTGSKAHNVAVRRRAVDRGLKINEYGVFRGEEHIAGADEAEIYALFDWPEIPPELREDRGELAAAEAGRLPDLIQRSDLRGNLHTHTTDSDGAADLDTMARAAAEAGLEYLAITDHMAADHVRGLSPDDLARQIDAIDQRNARCDDILVLKGVETGIDRDGGLDCPDDLLERLDVVVASLHDHLDLPRDRQTRRLCRAIDHPRVTIIGHPTARRIGGQAPVDLDLGTVFSAAQASGCVLEVSGVPDRLDLNDVLARRARDMGVKLSLAADAHHPDHFAWLAGAVDQARRGWVTADDVVNARDWPAAQRLLRGG